MNEINILCKAFLDKGFTKVNLGIVFNRFLLKYAKEWGKFGTSIPFPECLR